jgi:peptide/nickel transport system substrate-binding protein
VPIMPKHVLEAAFKSGTFAQQFTVGTPPDKLVSSGPWSLKQYVPNEKTVLARNPHYFGVDQQKHRLPYLNELVFVIVPDMDAADLKFRSGELDGLERVKPENYRYYEQNQQQGTFQLHDLGPRLSTNFFWFNLNPVRKPTAGKKVGEPQVGAVKYSWFNNPVFRRAVSMSIDRDAMIKSVFFGYGVKNWSTQTAGSKLWHSPDTKKFDYNPEEAKKLLAGLGWKDGNGDRVLEDGKGNPITFTLKTNSDNLLRVSMANLIRDDLARVGIRVVLTPVDFNTIISNIRDDFQYDALLLGLQTGVPPDPGMGQNVYRSSGRTHQWNISQPKPETPQEARIDALMDAIVGNPDLAARQKAWHEIEDIVNEMSWIIWLPTETLKVPVSSRFGNLRPTAIPHVIIRDIDAVFVRSNRST